jgi:hypothetical protein
VTRAVREQGGRGRVGEGREESCSRRGYTARSRPKVPGRQAVRAHRSVVHGCTLPWRRDTVAVRAVAGRSRRNRTVHPPARRIDGHPRALAAQQAGVPTQSSGSLSVTEEAGSRDTLVGRARRRLLRAMGVTSAARSGHEVVTVTGRRGGARRRRTALVVGLIVVAGLGPSAVLGQAEPSARPAPSASAITADPTLTVPAEGTVPIRFSVVGPLSPRDTRLELLTGQRSCGVGRDDPPYHAAHVAETNESVTFRVDVRVGPAGEPCASSNLIRVPVGLAQPLGERTLLDTASGEPPFVNPFDPIDTGFRYTCGGGFSSSIIDLVGPGLDVAGHGPPSRIAGARAVVDTGDVIEWIGPFERGRADWESWWFHDDRWEPNGTGSCSPLAVLPPGLDAAPWYLRGQRPTSSSRRIRVWVSEQACASGRPPVGRIARPLVQVRPGAIVIIMATEPLGAHRDWSRMSGGRRGAYEFIDCQGAPAAPYVVRLPVRLGDRALYDGGVFPPREHPGRRR